MCSLGIKSFQYTRNKYSLSKNSRCNTFYFDEKFSDCFDVCDKNPNSFIDTHFKHMQFGYSKFYYC